MAPRETSVKSPGKAKTTKTTVEIGRDVGRRLRVFVALEGLSIGHVVETALDRMLPPVEELSRRLRESEATA